jgi:AcrR family transcriptional regulator
MTRSKTKPTRSQNTSSSAPARRQSLSVYRRELILAAARRVFERQGFEGATMRAIAEEAGYTTGGLYGNYAGKEEIYADLLSQTLGALQAAVTEAAKAVSEPLASAYAAAWAFFDYYLRHPEDLDLGFYLFSGMKPRGLTTGLNRRLNDELSGSLNVITAALERAGWAPNKAMQTTASLFSHIAGALMLQHTGRIRLFETDCGTLVKDYLSLVISESPKESRDEYSHY